MSLYGNRYVDLDVLDSLNINNPKDRKVLESMIESGWVPPPGFLSEMLENSDFLNKSTLLIPVFMLINLLIDVGYVFNSDDLNFLAFYQDWNLIDSLRNKFDINLTPYVFEIIGNYKDLDLIKLLVDKYNIIPNPSFYDYAEGNEEIYEYLTHLIGPAPKRFPKMGPLTGLSNIRNTPGHLPNFAKKSPQ